MGSGAAANSEQHKELSLTFATSSMIKETDFIDQGAYEANLKRIQEAKEIVRRLETNNETAHKNFLVDQLEKRTQEGREAEVILARLKSQPGLPEKAQFNNSVLYDNPEVILPTTATLVEVPESPSTSYFTPASGVTPSKATPQIRPVEYQWNNAQVPQRQSYQSGAFRYYTSPSTSRPLHSAAPRSQVPVHGQMGGYTAPNIAPQYGPYNTSTPISSFQSMHVQQPVQPWNGYMHQVVSPSGVPVNYPTPWLGTVPPQSTGSSNAVYYDPKFSTTQVVASAPQANNFNQPQHVLSAAPTQVRQPAHGVAVPSSNYAPSTRTHRHPSDSQFRSTATTTSVPATNSEIQRPRPQPALSAPQHHQPQSRVQPRSAQPQHYSQELPSQQPIRPPETHSHTPVQSAGPVCLISQALGQPSRAPDAVPAVTSTGGSKTQLPPSHPSVAQEQTRQEDARIRADRATFIKLFQAAVQRGALHLKAFLLQAKACGISDGWFRAAFNSMSRDVWESLVTQANQATVDTSSAANVPRDEVPTISGSNLDVPVVSTGVSPTPLVQTTITPQSVVKPSLSAKESVAHSAKGQASQSYAAQLQYYAERATKSALLPGNTHATLIQDVSQPQVVLRTPKDANKSTLARDILRSLGKMPRPEVGGKPDDREDQLPTINLAQEEAASAVPNTPEVLAATDVNVAFDGTTAELQENSFSNLPKEESGPPVVTSGPIVIDLTLDYSDESVDGKREQPTFPIQTSSSPQPDSLITTTNRTPLLENLSLEESLIDVGDDADIRMYSPPLSMHPEENIESEFLYPQPDAPGLVSPSFGSLPHEASGHAIDGQLPLFLPSPPVSPAAYTEPPETVLEMVSDEGRSMSSVSYLKRPAADVDEKEVNAELVAPRIRKRRKQMYVLVPRAPLYVKKAIEKVQERAKRKDIDSELESVREDEEFRYSPLEQLLIEESKSRLLERRCRWLSCSAILNCAAHLLVHLKNHAQEENSETPGLFLCRWSNCQRQFSTKQERDWHLERHTTRPLPCPFAGCDEQFNKPVEVMQHEVQHQQAEHMERLTHKQTCQPIVPAIPARLGQPPHRLPSYRVIPRRVVKCRISAERHATMGPWVLWNIFSPVELNIRKQNASMRGRPMRQAIQYEMNSSDPRRDDYDFLLALSSYPAKNPQLDNLDSSVVTMSASRGLTLWGSETAINNEGSAAPEEGEEEVLRGKRERSEENSRPASAIQGEEDVVERMLIL